MEAYPDIPNDINIFHISHGLLDEMDALSFNDISTIESDQNFTINIYRAAEICHVQYVDTSNEIGESVDESDYKLYLRIQTMGKKIVRVELFDDNNNSHLVMENDILYFPIPNIIYNYDDDDFDMGMERLTRGFGMKLYRTYNLTKPDIDALYLHSMDEDLSLLNRLIQFANTTESNPVVNYYMFNCLSNFDPSKFIIDFSQWAQIFSDKLPRGLESLLTDVKTKPDFFDDEYLNQSQYIQLEKQIKNKQSEIENVKSDLDNLKSSYRKLQDLYFTEIKPLLEKYGINISLTYLIFMSIKDIQGIINEMSNPSDYNRLDDLLKIELGDIKERIEEYSDIKFDRIDEQDIDIIEDESRKGLLDIIKQLQTDRARDMNIYKTATKNRKKLEKKTKRAKSSYKTWKTLGNPRVLPSRTRKKSRIYYNMKKGGTHGLTRSRINTQSSRRNNQRSRRDTLISRPTNVSRLRRHNALPPTPRTPRRSTRLRFKRRRREGPYPGITSVRMKTPKPPKTSLKRRRREGPYPDLSVRMKKGGKRTKKKKGGKKPCWDKYKMVGMKNKNGKRVPKCVYKK